MRRSQRLSAKVQSNPSIPLHEQPLNVNPQSNSKLLNGYLPAEIRQQILFLALTEYTKPNELYAKSTGQYRPGYEGKKAITSALLQTCRLVYLETYPIPPTTKEHIFWHSPATGPYSQKFKIAFGFEHELYHFSRLTPWQLPLVKEIHLVVQLFWLERIFLKFCQKDFMQGIEKLKITIRRGDWWYNETGEPLGINPQRGHGNVAQMNSDVAAEKDGAILPWNLNGWGVAFAQLKSIKELTMELETSEYHKHQLIEIVKRAKTWQFPLQKNYIMCAKDTAVGEYTWTKGEPCTYCRKTSASEPTPPFCEFCIQRRSFPVFLNIEDLLHVRLVKWKKVYVPEEQGL